MVFIDIYSSIKSLTKKSEDTDDLAPAIYLIDVNTETNKEIKKLIITK